jgi:hypothetical protein
MSRDMSYAAVTARKNEIMKASLGIDFSDFISSPIAFDYERMMRETGYTHTDIARIQSETKVGNTPLYELRNITEAVRKIAGPGKGARIFVKDEAANASGSFKARRASISAYEAAKKGYKGIIAATSGNYGAAVASQAAQRGLKCIIVQEVFDSRGVGQPEIVEKSRACEAYGAEVLKLTVGPELFYIHLVTLEETGFFNASLYTPFGIRGVETLGTEIVEQVRARCGKDPDAVVITHAGGGNLTGTARGLLAAGAADTSWPARWIWAACIWPPTRISTANPSPPVTPVSACPSPPGPTGWTCRATRRAPCATWTSTSSSPRARFFMSPNC